jgi:hypothetical protein
MNRVPRQLIFLVLVGVVMLATSFPVFSQSCALCYTQAASAGARMIEALRSGILILIIPPTVGSIAVICVLYRKRNQFRQSGLPLQSERTW